MAFLFWFGFSILFCKITIQALNVLLILAGLGTLRFLKYKKIVFCLNINWRLEGEKETKELGTTFFFYFQGGCLFFPPSFCLLIIFLMYVCSLRKMCTYFWKKISYIRDFKNFVYRFHFFHVWVL